MDNAQCREVQQWLSKSQGDLEAARLLFESQAALLDIAVYHCQPQSSYKTVCGGVAATHSFIALSLG